MAKLYLCVFVTNCKGERSFLKLKLILNYLRNLMGQKRLAPLAVLLLEITFTIFSVWDKFLIIKILEIAKQLLTNFYP